MAPTEDSRKKTGTVATKAARAAREKKPRRSASTTTGSQIDRPPVALVRAMGEEAVRSFFDVRRRIPEHTAELPQVKRHILTLNLRKPRRQPVRDENAVSDLEESGADPAPQARSPSKSHEVADMQTKFRAVPLQRKKRGPRAQSALPAPVPHMTTSVATHEGNTGSDSHLVSSPGSTSSGTSAVSYSDMSYTTQARIPWTSQGARHLAPYLHPSSYPSMHSSGLVSGMYQSYLDYADATSEYIDHRNRNTPSSSSRPTPTCWVQDYPVPRDFAPQQMDGAENVTCVPRVMQAFETVPTHHPHCPIQAGYPPSQPPVHPLASATSGTDPEPRYLDLYGNRMALVARFELANKPKHLSGRIAHDPAVPHLAAPAAPTVERTVYSQEHPSFAGWHPQDDPILAAFTASLQEFGPVQLPVGVTGMAPYATGGGPDPSELALNHAPVETTGSPAFAGEPVGSSYFAWSVDGDIQDTDHDSQAGRSGGARTS